MFNVNQVNVGGTLTRDPEIKYTPKGMAIADIGMAVNRIRKDDQGNKKEETTFLNITAYGRQAEVIGEYCKKGHSIYVTGYLRMESWDDKQTGQKRTKLGVVLDNFQFVSKPQGSGKQPSKDDPAPKGEEDEIPF